MQAPYRAGRLFLSAVLICLMAASSHGMREDGLATKVARSDSTSVSGVLTPLVQLCNDAYSLQSGESAALPAGATVVLQEDDRDTGFRAKLYHLESGEYVVSYAGTDPKTLSDLWTDGQLVTGNRPKQFDQARVFCNRAVATVVTREHLSKPDAKGRVILTGHSLGGALAIYCGQVGGLSAFGINAPALNERLYQDVPYENRASFQNGPYYINFQTSNVDSNKKDQISVITLAIKKSWERLGREVQATVEVREVPSQCDADVLCHQLNNVMVEAINGD